MAEAGGGTYPPLIHGRACGAGGGRKQGSDPFIQAHLWEHSAHKYHIIIL